LVKKNNSYFCTVNTKKRYRRRWSTQQDK